MLWRLGKLKIERRKLPAAASFNMLNDVRSMLPKLTVHQMDNTYWSCLWADWLKIIDNDWLNRKGYQADEFDCDDFAIAFKARMSEKYGLNAVALIISYPPGHAYNIICPIDCLPIVFEPQTDELVTLGEGIYGIDSGFIVL